jgi:hypothetical protein
VNYPFEKLVEVAGLMLRRLEQMHGLKPNTYKPVHAKLLALDLRDEFWFSEEMEKTGIDKGMPLWFV